MSLPASSENKFDTYLLQIQENEQKKRRQRFFTVGALVCLLFSGFFLVQRFVITDQAQTRRTFQHNELTSEMVAQLFREDSLGILVTHPFLGEDTITSPADYQRFRELVELIQNTELSNNSDSLGQFVADRETSAEDLIQATPNAELQPFRVEIRGSQKAGKKMSFAIQHFDPSVRYTLDFGNGVRRTIRQRTQYTYPLEGVYTLSLIATSPDRGSSISVQTVDIQPTIPESIASANPELRPEETRTSGINISQLNRTTQYAVPRSSDNLDAGSATVRKPANLEIVDLGKSERQAAERQIVESMKRPATKSSKPLVYASKMPSFVGGRNALRTYLSQNLQYPAEAVNGQIQGQVVIQFVVQPDGSIDQPKVLRSLNNACDQEALRLVQNMPKWIPGESNGVRVPVYKTVPISFQISQ